jgi:hypothetical protein
MAQSQIDNTASPAVRPDIGVAVLELIDIVEALEAPAAAAPEQPEFLGKTAEGQPSRWYLRYPLSYRQAEELVHERGLSVDHTTIYRWVQTHAPELDKRCRAHWNRVLPAGRGGICRVPGRSRIGRSGRRIGGTVEQSMRRGVPWRRSSSSAVCGRK